MTSAKPTLLPRKRWGQQAELCPGGEFVSSAAVPVYYFGPRRAALAQSFPGARGWPASARAELAKNQQLLETGADLRKSGTSDPAGLTKATHPPHTLCRCPCHSGLSILTLTFGPQHPVQGPCQQYSHLDHLVSQPGAESLLKIPPAGLKLNDPC